MEQSDSDSDQIRDKTVDRENCSIANNNNPAIQIDDDVSNDYINGYTKFAIEIEDSGVGIPQDKIANIFMDFMKLD